MFFPLLFFLLGAVAASFAGLVAGRLSTGESIIGWSPCLPAGRSRCDACGAVLSPLALVPFFSFATTGGRAVCCGVRLSPLLPASELLLGLLFALAYLRLGLTSALAPFLVALALILALVFYDLAHQILPTPLLVALLAVSALAGYLSAPAAFLNSVLVALGIALFLAFIHFFSRGKAMGLADAPFVLALALLTGPYALSGILYSFWVGASIGIIILLARPKGSRMGVEVPFAPFLAIGFLLAYFTKWNILHPIGM